MIENLGENDLAEIPLLQIDSLALEKILKWTEKKTQENTPQPTSEEIKNKTQDSIDPWDESFLKMPLRDLYELVRKYDLNFTITYIFFLDYSLQFSKSSWLAVASY